MKTTLKTLFVIGTVALCVFLWGLGRGLSHKATYGYLSTRHIVVLEGVRSSLPTNKGFTLELQITEDYLGVLEIPISILNDSNKQNITVSVFEDNGRQIANSSFSQEYILNLNSIMNVGLPSMERSKDKRLLIRVIHNGSGAYDRTRDIVSVHMWPKQLAQGYSEDTNHFIRAKLTSTIRDMSVVEKVLYPVTAGLIAGLMYVFLCIYRASIHVRMVCKRYLVYALAIAGLLFGYLMEYVVRGLRALNLWQIEQRRTNPLFVRQCFVTGIFAWTNIVLIFRNNTVPLGLYFLWICVIIVLSILLKIGARVHYGMAFIHLLICINVLQHGQVQYADNIAVLIYFYLCLGAGLDIWRLYKHQVKH